MTMAPSTILQRYGHLVGTKVGNLTFIAFSPRRDGNNRLFGDFLCDCGGTTRLALGRFFSGKTITHCGCKTDKGAHRIHGMRNSPEYSSWRSMKARCLDERNKDFPRYGARGIMIAPAWISSFETFYSDIGPRPPGTSLDRIDNSKGYEPGNVQWATAPQQQRNRSTSMWWSIKGHTFETADEAAEAFGVSAHTVWRWVNGQFDKRRGTFTMPRKDCYATPRY